jgi:hypothetical protein
MVVVMQRTICAHCAAAFAFDPAKIWSSPSQTGKRSVNGSQKVVIQCPKCQKWLSVELKDDPSSAGQSPTSGS